MTTNVNSNSEHMKEKLKNLSQLRDGNQYKYSVAEIFGLIRVEIDVEFSEIELIINAHRKEGIFSDLNNDFDKNIHDFSNDNSNERVAEFMSILIENIKIYKIIENIEIERVFDIPENKILTYPIELFKLVLNYYKNTMANDIIGFSINELNFEKKLINLFNYQNEILPRFLFSKASTVKMNILKEIFNQIQFKRAKIEHKYKPVIKKFEQFLVFKNTQIKERSFFITQKDFQKYDSNIIIAILQYIEYYYFKHGEFIDLTIWQDIIDCYRMAGFCFSEEEVLRYNSLNLVPWSEKYFETVSMYHNRKIISDDEYYSVFYVLPALILSKQKFIDQLITKIQEIYENPLNTSNIQTINKISPEILIFSVEPNIIQSGVQVTIKWATKNVENVKISGLGEVSPSGTRVFKFDEYFDLNTKSISIFANNEKDSVSQTIEITYHPKIIPNFASDTAKLEGINIKTILGIVVIISVIIIGFKISTYNNSKVQPQQTRNLIQTTKSYLGPEVYINEMLTGQTQNFSLKNHPKAFDKDWEIKVPQSWEILPSDKSHVIIKMGTKDKNPHAAVAISANKITVHDGRLMSNHEIEEFFDDPNFLSDIIAEKGNLISGKKFIIDSNPGFIAEYETIYQNENYKLKMRTLNFYFVVDNVLFILVCTVTSADLTDNLKVLMDEYRDFFKLLANSIDIKLKGDWVHIFGNRNGNFYKNGHLIHYKSYNNYNVPLNISSVNKFANLLVSGESFHEELHKFYNHYISIYDYVNASNYSSVVWIEMIDQTEYLFVILFSGGAHCCVTIEAFHFDETLDAFKFIDKFDAKEIEILDPIYPFEFSRSGHLRNYQPTTLNVCDTSVYSEKLYLVDGKFKFIARGDLIRLEKCLSDYVTNNRIVLMKPAKNDMLYWSSDYTSHSEVMSILYDIYTIMNDVNMVKILYLKYCSDLEKKYELWNDDYFKD